MGSHRFYFILGVIIVLIWGTTFVSTKVLITNGLVPHEIFFVRFLVAYFFIWFFSPRILFANNIKDEFQMIVLGVVGGSLYFVTENFALSQSYTTNVSFIVCSSPLLATILAVVIYRRKTHVTWNLVLGTIMAVLGVFLLISNGRFMLKPNSIGDILALVACLSWAVYSLLIKKLLNRYSSVFLTRKVFFYGVITVSPLFLWRPWQFPLSDFTKPVVLGNIAYLSLCASLACFSAWAFVVKHIGVMKATNLVYLNPISTMVASIVFLSEPISFISAIGSFLILLGVIVSDQSKFCV